MISKYFTPYAFMEGGERQAITDAIKQRVLDLANGDASITQQQKNTLTSVFSADIEYEIFFNYCTQASRYRFAFAYPFFVEELDEEVAIYGDALNILSTAFSRAFKSVSSKVITSRTLKSWLFLRERYEVATGATETSNTQTRGSSSGNESTNNQTDTTAQTSTHDETLSSSTEEGENSSLENKKTLFANGVSTSSSGVANAETGDTSGTTRNEVSTSGEADGTSNTDTSVTVSGSRDYEGTNSSDVTAQAVRGIERLVANGDEIADTNSARSIVSRIAEAFGILFISQEDLDPEEIFTPEEAANYFGT